MSPRSSELDKLPNRPASAIRSRCNLTILPSPLLLLSNNSEIFIVVTPMMGLNGDTELCLTVISNVAESSEEELADLC